jgi:hypothetical protein
VHLEKDKMHIDFLNDKWVSDQAKAGKLTLASVTTSNGIALLGEYPRSAQIRAGTC